MFHHPIHVLLQNDISRSYKEIRTMGLPSAHCVIHDLSSFEDILFHTPRLLRLVGVIRHAKQRERLQQFYVHYVDQDCWGLCVIQ